MHPPFCCLRLFVVIFFFVCYNKNMKKQISPKKRKTIGRRLFDEFNLKKQAENLGVSVWQTPNFLFIVMGIIVVTAMTGVYIVSRY